jgi:autotransporter-associated beta strand protein
MFSEKGTMKSIVYLLAGAAILAAGNSDRAHGAVVMINPSQDNSIYSENENSNALGNLFAGHTADHLAVIEIRRALMMFDIAGNIPVGSTVNSVTLDLRQIKTNLSAPSALFALHPLTATWGEGTSSGAGQGGAATAGDATWHYNLFNSSSWSTAGGDFGSSSGTSLFGTGSGIIDTFNSQSGMVADVQNWLTTPAANFGWILLASNESVLSTARELGSRQSGTPPVLTVNFTVPAGTPAAWRSAISGNWSDATKWNTDAAPNAAGASAVLIKATTTALTVTLDSPETIGTLALGNSASDSVGYILSGSNSLTLSKSGNGATITASDGSHAINVPVILASNLVVAAPPGDTSPWTLAFGAAGGIFGSGKSLTMNGAGGLLILNGTDSYSGGTTVTAGTLTVTSAAGLADGSRLTVGDSLALAPMIPAATAGASPVPEPGTLVLLAAGAIAAAIARLRRRRMSRY